MTITSAASLPGHGHEAPFPTFPSFRGNVRRSRVPRISPATAPQRQLPRTALADDPPRGRILVVTDEARLALDVQRFLRDAGYRAVGPAASANEAERLTSCCPIDGAVVDLQLEDGAAATVADRLAGSGIPFVWLTDIPFGGLPQSHGFVPVVAKPVRGEELIRTLERALLSKHRDDTGSFYPVPPPQEVWPRVFPQL
jgi:CheY-like chemotaxis protein